MSGFLTLAAAVACSSGDGGTDPGDDPAIALALSASAATVSQGGQTQVTGTLTRSGGFTGVVSFTVSGAPAGVTATVGNIQTSGGTTTATITILVGATTPLGTHNITVRASGSGVTDDVEQFALTVTAPPDFVLSLNLPAVSLVQGTNRNDVVVTITRTNFTDPVTLSLTQGTVIVPAGVTASFSPAAPTGTSSTMTLTVGAAAPPGTYALSITGIGSLGTRTTPFTLTITAAGSFTLAVAPLPATVTLQQGTSDNSKSITITRTNYTPAVTLTAEGFPNGVSASFAGNPVTGTISQLTLTATAGATLGGPVNVTIRGTGPAALRGPGATADLEATTTLALTVTAAPPPGNVVVDFSGCPAASKPVWLAVQDGTTAPFVRVPGVNDVYQFNITLGKGGIAWVTLGTGTSVVNVQYLTQAELATATLRFCSAPAPAGENLNGTVMNLATGFAAIISFGGASTLAFADGPFQLSNAKDAQYQLNGYMRALAGGGGGDRGFRSALQNPANGGSVGTVSFLDPTFSFPAAVASATVTGTVSGEMMVHNMSLYAGQGSTACTLSPLFFGNTFTGANTSTGFALYGFPVSRLSGGEVHSIFMSAASVALTSFRSLTEEFADPVARAATPFVLPQPLPTPAIQVAGALYKRLTATVTNAPTEYTLSAFFGYTDQVATGRSVAIGASYGWLTGFNFSLGLPDFTGVSGWDNNWAPGPSNQVDWSLSASGTSSTAAGCPAGRRFVTGTKTGTA